MLVEVLEQIYNAEFKFGEQSQKASSHGTERTVNIDNIDPNKPLFEVDSCLEYLIVGFCKNFDLKPKQSAGLLTQGYKFLAHIIVKGLKGNFEPVLVWYQDVYSNTERLTELILNESDEGSINFILSALKPGLLSKDTEIVQWAMRVFSKLALEFSENGLLEKA